jgi:hypothetical protein
VRENMMVIIWNKLNCGGKLRSWNKKGSVRHFKDLLVEKMRLGKRERG